MPFRLNCEYLVVHNIVGSRQRACVNPKVLQMFSIRFFFHWLKSFSLTQRLSDLLKFVQHITIFVHGNKEKHLQFTNVFI